MSHSILIVEDLVDLAEMLSMMFDLHGFETRIAHDGLSAMEMLSSFHPDLIISDYMMPNLDGLQFWHRAKANPATKDIPFILTSAISERPELASIPFDAVVKKPVEFDVLLAQVNAVLSPG